MIVNRFDLRRSPYYQSGELIGRQELRKLMKMLRGIKGVRYLQRDKFNRVIGPYQKGDLDTLPTKAQDIYLTWILSFKSMDKSLQQKREYRCY